MLPCVDYDVYVKKRWNLYSEVELPWAFFFTKKLLLKQGWKIHLSVIPSEAFDLVDMVFPILVNNEIPFKIVKGIKEHRMINSGLPVPTVLGKVMTIYPNSKKECVKLALELVKITDSLHGPVIPTDLRIGNIVYVRYGAFIPIKKVDRFGREVLFIRGPRNKLYEDKRDVPFRVPFKMHMPSQFIKKSSSFVRPPLKKDTNYNGTIVGERYLIAEIINSKITGSIFGAFDINRLPIIRPITLKQGRKYCVPDRKGGDIINRLEHQEKMHQYLYSKISIPRVDPFFEEYDCGYLPIEYVKGQTIFDYLGYLYSSNEFKPKSKLILKQKKLVFTLVELLARLHNLGIIHGDLNPQNLIIDNDENVWIIDLESSHFADEPSPNSGTGTPGFNSFHQRLKGETEFADDIYTLGACILYILIRLHPETVAYSSHKEDLFIYAGRNIFSKKLAKEFSLCMSNNPKKTPTAMELLELMKNEMDID